MESESPTRRTVLVVSASMGGGHDGAARELRRRLTDVGHQVHIVDFLTLAELRIGWLLMAIYRFQLRVAPWS